MSAAYWRAVATALQAQIVQATIVVPEYLTPMFIIEYVGTGHGAPRFMSTTSADLRPGWQMVARVDPDGQIARIGGAS